MTDTINQEVRFAVVMYGGSSLAIYMNGVAQELFHLVRATAPKTQDDTRPYVTDEELRSSEAVYRELGRLLSRNEDPTRDITTSPIRTRFMIDILSGTSAGGINAVFLAKALVNDQEFESLKELWVEKGDVDVLFNDNHSSVDKKVPSQKQPKSPFNSDLMYYELLDALQKMDNKPREKKSPWNGNSPYVEELDLYTTATDIQGQKITVKLADKVAEERRHNSFFHFIYKTNKDGGKERNDFKKSCNPFLAFAARCTSAHPAAFEPMRLADIDDILKNHEDYSSHEKGRANDASWDAFYEEYLQVKTDKEEKMGLESLRKTFQERSFSDGGVLDNSPFSFVIDQLQFRDRNLPVDRKLIYVEPVPEHVSDTQEVNGKPDFLKNAAISLSTLPSYQFIRDDLKRLLQRNQLVERVNRILQGIEKDESLRLKVAIGSQSYKRPLDSTDFSEKEMGEMIKLMGTAWGGYQRLRVAQTTDELVLMFSRAAGLDEQSDEFSAIRNLVRVWRFENYDPYTKEAQKTAKEKQSENEFLYRYDLSWRIRRLKFVLKKVDEIKWLQLKNRGIRLTENGKDFEEQAKMMFAALKTATEQKADKNTDNLSTEQLQELFTDLDDFLNQTRHTEGLKNLFSTELRQIKERLSGVMKNLYKSRQQLMSRLDDKTTVNPLQDAILKLGITRDDLRLILKEPEGRATEEAAMALYQKNYAKFAAFVSVIEAAISQIRLETGREVVIDTDAILKIPDFKAPLTPEILIRTLLRYYYDNFDRYDMISFPLLFATNVGEETDVVEVFRVSPEDADCLITDKDKRLRKLGGTKLGNFGAFFDKKIRINDILWGRLDCAERLISALMQTASQYLEGEGEERKEKRTRLETKRIELIKAAQREIVLEELNSKYKEEICSLLGVSVNEDLIKVVQGKLKNANLDAGIQEYLVRCLQNRIENFDNISNDFDKLYKFDHPLNPSAMVRASGRGSKIIGKILENIANQRQINNASIRWFTRITQLFWGLVEVALPGSVADLLWSHWRKLLYFLEFLLILLGTFFVNSTIQNFGFFLFGCTISLHAAVLLLKDVMQGKRILVKLSAFALVIGLLALFGHGLAFFSSLMEADSASWKMLEEFRKGYTNNHPDLTRTLLRYIPVVVVGLVLLYAMRDDLLQIIRICRKRLLRRFKKGLSRIFKRLDDVENS
jgi:patatin-related protein